ncbi:MAG: apolipoprotein N-acyltransferase [Rhodobacteraceae bacterium]|nr:apolipoprotein N-acyltransferase [Paracoccaceae bacterium]
MIAVSCGFGLAAGAAPFSMVWFLFVAVPVLGWMLLSCQTARQGFGIGWWAGLAYFGGSMYWIIEPFFIDTARHAWMAPFALILVATGMTLFWGAAFALAARFIGWPRIVAMIFFWVVAEYARSFILTGFPWGMLAYGWSETPVFQTLSWAGPHGLTALTLSIACLPIVMNRGGGAAVLVCVAGLWGLGTLRMSPAVPTETVVRLVQPNAPQHLKWNPGWIQKFYDRAVAYTAAEAPPTIVVWPETSFPFMWDDSPGMQAQIIASARGAHIILGHRKHEGDRVKNSLLHLDGEGRIADDYDKHHLVPFGEYIPLGELAAEFELYGLAANDRLGFAAGPGPRLISVEGVPDYIPLICYEAIFPAYSRFGGLRPQWLLHITNDAWFGNFAGPYQHLVQARARAIEQGLPLARAANTGISAMIDPFGRIQKHAALGTGGFVDAALPQALPPTPYSRFGDFPLFAVLAAMFAFLLLHRQFLCQERR